MKVFLVLILGIMLSAGTCSAAKIAAVDLVRIYDEYPLIKEANDVLDKAEASFRRVLETADKELKSLEQNSTQEAILAKQDAIQDIVDDEMEDLQDTKDFYNLQINRNIDQAIKTIAKRNSYDLILNRSHTVSPTEDITEKLILELNSIPIQKLDDDNKSEKETK